MTFQLTPDLEQKLETLATQDGRTALELAQEAIGIYLKHIETLATDIREAEEEAGRDGWIPHEEVVARIDKRFPKSA